MGEPFTIEGELYTPEDTYSYDMVGLASLDPDGGDAVTVAHKTLPMPSYVEVTSLETGRTILTRVERRGPMVSDRLVALSPGAAQQLGIGDGEAVRVRRVNPPEAERAELRSGGQAPERLSTPPSLLAVLKRKLPAAPLAAKPELPERSAGAVAPLEPAAVAPSSALADGSPVTPAEDHTAGPPKTAPTPEPVRAATSASASEPAGFVVQAGTFASRVNADRLASKLEGGFVTKAGKFYRVRTGPYPTRGQAEAALAKVRAAGYSDAQVFSAG